MSLDIVKSIGAYFTDRREVVAVYLFGSHAAGRPGVMSDVDIAILFDSYSRAAHRARCAQYVPELSRRVRKVVHPVILNSAGEEIVRQILSKGTCIVVNDPAVLARYRMTMLSKIADFAYLQGQMQRGFTKNLLAGKNPHG